MSEDREPTKEQKAAAYDKFMAWLQCKGRAYSLHEKYYEGILLAFALETPIDEES